MIFNIFLLVSKKNSSLCFKKLSNKVILYSTNFHFYHSILNDKAMVIKK